MQNTKILGLMAVAMLTTAAIACRTIPRMETSTRLLPVDSFPRQIADWKSNENIPTDPEVQAKLPTAHILERDYTNSSGKIANLMLVTATDDEDFHKPTACLPSQGWALQHRQTILIDGQTVNVLNAIQNNSGFTVLYYWIKLKGSPPPSHSLLGAAATLRRHLVHEEMSLFVRVVMTDRPEDRTDLDRFTALVWQKLQPMLGGNGEIVLRT